MLYQPGAVFIFTADLNTKIDALLLNCSEQIAWDINVNLYVYQINCMMLIWNYLVITSTQTVHVFVYVCVFLAQKLPN